MAGRDQVGAMEEFVARHGLDEVTHIADSDGTVWARFGVGGQPAWIFVDGETGAYTQAFGGLGEDGLTAQMEALAGE